jgi:hypothetical protein
MKRRLTAALGLLAMVAMVGCAGVRQTDDTFAAHASCLRIVGFAIPGDDMAAARAMVPEGATIHTVSASAADWTSVWGILGNIIGIHCTSIAGTK